MEMIRLRGTGLPNPSRETKLSGANADIIFPVQLTTSRIGSLTRLIHTLAIRVTIHRHTHTTYCVILPVFRVVGNQYAEC